MIGKNTVLQISFDNTSPMWSDDTSLKLRFINSMCTYICDQYLTYGMICLNEIRKLFGIPLTIDGYHFYFVNENDELTYEVLVNDGDPESYIIRFFKKGGKSMNENNLDMATFISKCGEIALFWKDKLPMLAMEEAGELIQAISKMERELLDINPDKITREANYEFAKKLLISEIGDMYISLMALQIFYVDDFSMEDVERYIKEKLNKKYV